MSDQIVWTERAILDAFESFVKANGRVPTQVECRNSNGLPGKGTVALKFGSFNKALDQMGYARNRTMNYTGEEAMSALRRFASVLKRRPTRADLDESDFSWLPTSLVYDRLFGSLTNALISIGFAPYSPAGRHKISDEDLLLSFRHLARRLGHIPKHNAFRGNAKGVYPSDSTYTVRFGSWSNAVQRAFPHARFIGVPLGWLPLPIFLSIHRLMRALPRWFEIDSQSTNT